MSESKSHDRSTTALQSSTARVDASAPTLDFEKYRLDNDLEVILLVERRLPLVAVNVWYHVGPANEEPGRTGFAHLFEHMMFQGSKHLREDSHIKILEAAGASEINGTTDFDRTNYFETLPSNELPLALWLESDRMGYLIDRIDQKNLTNQQDVVRNERRQSVENQPYGIVEEELYHLLFPEAHPYYASVIGSHADIQAAQLDEIHAFFRRFYSPSNASLAIVGDIDVAETKKLVERHFGSLRSGSSVPRPVLPTPPIEKERRAAVRDRVELPRVFMAWLTPSIFTPGDAEADVAAIVLGGGKSSRLYKRLVYEKQIAQDVRAQQYSLQLSSVFSIVVTARPGTTADEIERAIDSELARFRAEGPSEQEVARARNTYETRILQGLETLGGFGGVADRLNLYNHFLGDPEYLARDLARYRNVRPEAILAFAREHLAIDKRAVVHGVPGTPELGVSVPTPAAPPPTATTVEPVNVDETWRYDRPESGDERLVALPVPERFQLANGLTVIWSRRPGVPVVAANLIVRAGSGANPVEKPGVASFTAAMLDEGTEGRSSLEIADEVAQLGASLSVSSTMDGSFAMVRSLESHFERVLEILADVVRRPVFPAEEVERQRASRLASFAQQNDSAGLLAGRAMGAALYGAAHPYGLPEIGTEASLGSLSSSDFRAFWGTHFVPKNTALVVTGDIHPETLGERAEEAFAEWSGSLAPAAALPPAARRAARVVLVDKPGAPQTVLRVARIGAARRTEDYEALQVLNATLGGLFSSRINLNLRETNGYTYGAGSAFVFRRSPGPFFIGTAVRADVTAPAVSEILREIRRMTVEPPSDEEIGRAKSHIVRSLPGEFETSGSAAASFSSLFLYDLPGDYYTGFAARVLAVSREAIAEAAARYLVPESFVVVAVGDLARIEKELRALELGPVEVWRPDGTSTVDSRQLTVDS